MKALNDIEHNLKDYYAQKVGASDASTQMGWKSQWAQEVRFIQLLKVVEGNTDFSINDLGCGNGSLYHFMKPTFGTKNFSYFGYDILPEMLAEANKLNPDGDFTLIKSASEMNHADYTVASGIFNLKYNANDAQWLEFIHDTIADMWAKSGKGIAFNCLTGYSDAEFMRPELYYTDALALFDFCQKKFTRHLALLHDYREYDFTMILRKS